MKVTITKFEDCKPYTAPGHDETVHTMHMQHKSMGCEAPYWVGCSYYLPGATAHLKPSPLDKIYIVLEGELVVEYGDKQFETLRKGDSIWIGQNETRGVKNESNAVATMLVVMPYPAA